MKGSTLLVGDVGMKGLLQKNKTVRWCRSEKPWWWVAKEIGWRLLTCKQFPACFLWTEQEGPVLPGSAPCGRAVPCSASRNKWKAFTFILVLCAVFFNTTTFYRNYDYQLFAKTCSFINTCIHIKLWLLKRINWHELYNLYVNIGIKRFTALYKTICTPFNSHSVTLKSQCQSMLLGFYALRASWCKRWFGQ